MVLNSINPEKCPAWKSLSDHYSEMRSVHMRDLFTQNPDRASKMTIRTADFLFDYSKNIASEKTVDLLVQLAREVRLEEAIGQYFGGARINETEGRAVMHTALRSDKSEILIGGENVVPEIQRVNARMKQFCENVISGSHKGFSGKRIKTVVNIGIGGSDLGPAMVVEALKFYKNQLDTHFVSNVDGDHIAEVLQQCDPESTLFVIVSKTFTTQETLANAEFAKSWFLKSGNADAIGNHFVAVSSNVETAVAYGIAQESIFPMWDWVGGRFSIWSSVGLSIALAVGYDNFEQMRAGALTMDKHFESAPFKENIPVVMAMLSVWYNNFFGAESEAVIPYAQYLSRFAPYLQQAVMESNGKSVARNGETVSYQTGNIIWGEPGTNAQHAFFQLIHQGTKLIPADFIGFGTPLHGNWQHHDKLMSNFFAQTEALLKGKTEAEVNKENKGSASDEAKRALPFKVFAGNKPTNTLLIDKLTPESLGGLIALYEHKIFVQGIVWNIFSYDQWGVELGKQMANVILSEFDSPEPESHDGSTAALIDHYLRFRNAAK